MDRLDIEAREIASRTSDSSSVDEGLGLFGEIWEKATPEERKELMQLHVYKVIFTPTEVKMGLNTRPTFEEHTESTAVHHANVGAVDPTKWLPTVDVFRTLDIVTRPGVVENLPHLAQVATGA